MSIISQALKKAQKEREGKENLTLPPSDLLSLKPGALSKNVPDRKNMIVYLPLVLVLVFGGVVATWIFLNFQAPGNTSASHQTSAALVVEKPVKPSTKQSTQTTKSPVPAKIPEKPTEGLPSEALKNKPETEWKVPPIKEMIKSTRSQELPMVNGIMYSPTSPQAIINGVLLSEGETAGRFTVIRILPKKVVISLDDKKIDLVLR